MSIIGTLIGAAVVKSVVKTVGKVACTTALVSSAAKIDEVNARAQAEQEASMRERERYDNGISQNIVVDAVKKKITQNNISKYAPNVQDFIGHHYANAVAAFKSEGFENVEVVERITRDTLNIGNVCEITICGKSQISHKKIYSQSSPVVITYYNYFNDKVCNREELLNDLSADENDVNSAATDEISVNDTVVYCGNCGTKLLSSYTFCSNCGYRRNT